RGGLRLSYRLRLGGNADLQRINPDRLGDVLQLGLAEIGDGEIEPPSHEAIGVLGQTDRARLGNAFQARCDVDAVAINSGCIIDDVPEIDADAELHAPIPRHIEVALRHDLLDGDGAFNRPDGTRDRKSTR